MKLLAKNLLFTLVAPGNVAGLLPWWIASGRPPAAAPWRAAAIAAFAVGGALYAWCVWDFAHFGRATPAPIDAPRRLVARGAYRAVRNPMYVGVLCIVCGWALYFASGALLLYGAVVAAVFHGFVLAYEEPHLRREFGAEYRAYCERVGRWCPRIRRGGPG